MSSPVAVLEAGERFVRFGTKGDTLLGLGRVVRRSVVPELLVFPVQKWTRNPDTVQATVAARFGGARLAVRSSARGEDGTAASMAGAYASFLNVDGRDPAAVAAAVDAVVASYEPDAEHAVMVQRMIAEPVVMSGVVMTHDLNDGSPYYTINYDDESGRTDTITGGTGVNKTVLVYRGAPREAIASPRITRVIEMVEEVEMLTGGVPLDVEFCLGVSGTAYLLQVRQIALRSVWDPAVAGAIEARLLYVASYVTERSQPRAGLVGSRTILGVMPDWNPAEIVGTTPPPLAASLYRHLITHDVWRRARALMGYRELPAEDLMVLIGGRPYIDVRNSFNSFLPAELPEATGERVVDVWLDRLSEHPELHDRVEFSVAQTCYDFCFQADIEGRYGTRLPTRDRRALGETLRRLTAAALDLGPTGSFRLAERSIDTLADLQERRGVVREASLSRVGALLEECRTRGTLAFAVLARHAFIAEALLRSAVRREALAIERLEWFRRSVRTVSGEFAADLHAASRGDLPEAVFLERWGHLRPGTYDVRSPVYRDRADLLRGAVVPRPRMLAGAFVPSALELRALDALAAEAGLGVDAHHVLEYAASAIAARERAKFVFSRSLSDALECLAAWGEAIGLTRDDVAHLQITDLLNLPAVPVLQDPRAHFTREAAKGRWLARLSHALKLPHLIERSADLYVFPTHRSFPNFVGSGRVHAAVVEIDSDTPAGAYLAGRIVCIRNADPGFDWVFGKAIAGLITQYGGTNSHMAIRCAEFGLPAAIGCGAQLYARVVAAGVADLDCAGKALRPGHEY